jgi:hypothetical protein
MPAGGRTVLGRKDTAVYIHDDELGGESEIEAPAPFRVKLELRNGGELHHR